MYDYNPIKSIRDNLRKILAKNNGLNLPGLTATETAQFAKAISDYDLVLEKIGPSGTCDDRILIDGMIRTEEMIQLIEKKRR